MWQDPYSISVAFSPREELKRLFSDRTERLPFVGLDLPYVTTLSDLLQSLFSFCGKSPFYKPAFAQAVFRNEYVPLLVRRKGKS